MVRLYLEKRARDKEEAELQAAEGEKAMQEAEKRNSMLEHVPAQQLLAPTPDKEDDKQEKSKFRLGRNRKKSEDMDDELTEAELYQSPRPAFSANARGTKRSQIPHDVAIPYFRFRKDRFYDWPPDPTVSRATPLHGIVEEEDTYDNGTKLSLADFLDQPDSFDKDIRGTKFSRPKETAPTRKNSHDRDTDFGYGY